MFHLALPWCRKDDKNLFELFEQPRVFRSKVCNECQLCWRKIFRIWISQNHLLMFGKAKTKHQTIRYIKSSFFATKRISNSIDNAFYKVILRLRRASIFRLLTVHFIFHYAILRALPVSFHHRLLLGDIRQVSDAKWSFHAIHHQADGSVCSGRRKYTEGRGLRG